MRADFRVSTPIKVPGIGKGGGLKRHHPLTTRSFRRGPGGFSEGATGEGGVPTTILCTCCPEPRQYTCGPVSERRGMRCIVGGGLLFPHLGGA